MSFYRHRDKKIKTKAQKPPTITDTKNQTTSSEDINIDTNFDTTIIKTLVNTTQYCRMMNLTLAQ